MQYAVDPEEVSRVLSENRDPESFSTGLLSPDIIYMHEKDKMVHTISYRKPQQTGVWLEREDDEPEVIRVPLPGLIMCRRLRDTYVDHFVWAVTETPTATSKLYNAPLPNIDLNAHVCWGTVRQDQSPHKNDLSADWSRLLGSATNNHSTGRKSHINDDIRDRLRALDGQDTYTLDDLIASKRTLKSLIGDIENGKL